MRRRQFLRSGIAISAAAVAGCSSDGGETATATPTATETATATETTATHTETRSPTATPTPEETATPSPTERPSRGPPRLETDGEWIVTADGERFTPRGVNLVEPLFGDRFADARGATYEESLRLATSVADGWYNRVLRVPVTQWGLDQLGYETYARRFLDPTIEHCRKHGVYVILDNHLIADWKKRSVHDAVEAFWEFFASRYADRPNVLYELFNEPQKPDDDTLGTWKAWKDVAQPWVDLIRERAPETPIIVGSPGWTSLTKYADDSPFEGENLIYAGHIYPGDGKSAGALEPEYGEPAETVPVMITEWGYDGTDETQPGTTSNFGTPFREWLSTHENVGWTAWCFDSHWHPTMFDYGFNLTGGETYHGWFVKEWLYDARTDHVPGPLREEDGPAFEGPTDDSRPGRPTNPKLTPNDDGTVTLAWDQATDDRTRVLHYNVYVDRTLRDQVDTITLFNEASVEDAFDRTDLRFDTRLQGLSKPGKTYEVYLTAVDSLSNESPPSPILTRTVSGDLTIHAEIPKAGDAPTIDGTAGSAWSNATERPFQHVVRGTVDSSSDLGGGWRATWDESALYVLAEVTDDAASSDSEAIWKDDSVELYVDGDNSKLTEYDGTNDFQIKFPRDDRPFKGTIPNDLGGAEVAKRETEQGWRLEVALPWSALAPEQSIEAGHVVGFDAHVNDDDDGDGRDGKLTWFNEQDDSWKNPSAFANVKLVD